jgi:hypothetical protein
MRVCQWITLKDSTGAAVHTGPAWVNHVLQRDLSADSQLSESLAICQTDSGVASCSVTTESENSPAYYLPHVRRLRGNVVPGLEQMESAIEFLPPQIADAKMYCPSCQTDVPVPLKKAFPEPYTPVFPRDYHPVTNNKFWQLVALEVECPTCKGKVRLEPPRKRWTKTVTLYGDEAVRETVARPFVCIALVGGSNHFVESACDRVNALKKTLEPEREPTSWRFHMADLHSGQKRKRHKIFADWDREKCAQAVNGLFNIIAESNDSLFVFALIYPIGGSSMIEAKRKAHMAILCDTIYNFTQLGVSPRYTFDADKAVGSNRSVIQHWARSAFLGSERQLMYLYLCHGVPVLEPQFVKPGSHICLELSDFAAFVVARELHCWQNRRESEYPSSQFGNVYYSWPDKEGCARERIRGVPRDRIFPTNAF